MVVVVEWVSASVLGVLLCLLCGAYLLQAIQVTLGLLGCLAHTLQGQAVAAQVNARLALELVDDVVHQSVVKVLTTQQRVAVGGLHLKDAVRDLAKPKGVGVGVMVCWLLGDDARCG